MALNRYQPPAAEVADPARGEPPRPKAVTLACQLLLATLVLGLATYLPGIRIDHPEEAEVPFMVSALVLGVFCGLSLLFIAKCLEGRNWARWANLAYLALGWWLALPDIGAHFLQSPMAGTLESVMVALELVACWLLFTGAGHHWFRTLAQARARR